MSNCFAWIDGYYCSQNKCLEQFELVLNSFKDDICGMKGCIYDVCVNKNSNLKCKYVIKVIDLDEELEDDENNFETEASLMKYASDVRIGPKFKNSFKCNYVNTETKQIKRFGFFVMEKFKMNLADFLEQNKHIDEENLKLLLDELRDKAINANFYHGDLRHAGNIAINIDKNNKINNAILIDFGESQIVNNKNKIINEWNKFYNNILFKEEGLKLFKI